MRSSLALRLTAGGLAVLLLSTAAPASPQNVSQQDADRLQKKIEAIARRGEQPKGAELRTPVSETEVNAYLAFSAGWFMPSGVVGPQVSIGGDDRVWGQATVDLDTVRRERNPGWLNPLKYLSGRVLVTAQGILRTRDGVARFQLEAAEIGGVPVPKVVLQEIVGYYTRSEEYPRGINLDDPFPLPARIRAIEQQRWQAVVVQ
jgi:hypothetical protein